MCLPNNKNIKGRYVEPFLGSGAVFLSILPENALLSDINNELIDIYLGIRSDADAVWRNYRRFGETKADYYHVRDVYRPYSLYGRAARSLYLNRTCFKGMWRHNSIGKFNVGYGGQKRRWVIDLKMLRSVSRELRGIDIDCCDFEMTLKRCSKDDFVFCDPPYKPGQLELSNAHYSGEQFSIGDQQRLAGWLNQLDSIGVLWALTISSHEKILNMYKNNYAVSFTHGTGSMPGEMVMNPGEVLITNYKTQGGILL